MFGRASPASVEHSMAGVLDLPSGRGVVSDDPGPIVADWDEPRIFGDCSGNDDTGCKRVANDASRAIVGC